MRRASKVIAESSRFIILEHYERLRGRAEGYQSEAELEAELIQDLVSQGYAHRADLRTPAALLANVRVHLEALNAVRFTDAEWRRFVEDWLNHPSEGATEKSKKVHEHDTLDFTFDSGALQNIKLFDKENLLNNTLEIVDQFEQTGTHANRYDVTLLVNGLPLVQIELKRRGVNIREAFNQVHRYSRESFNSPNSLFKYIQVFVISNGTETRYFANTTQRNQHSFDFTMNWAQADNQPIKDLKDFTATFFQKNTLLQVLFRYAVLNTDDILLIMRPYQIAAAERILWKIESSFHAKGWSKPEGGGYIWHTTGSGKTLTSFKAARLATQLEFIDKVFFVVDRKDLDYQTMREYQKFSPDSVNGSTSTRELLANLSKDRGKIVVTTIQKLNNLMKSAAALPIYEQQVVFIFDECHRSQFGEAQQNLRKKFRRYYQFGFTGTPIFPENALGAETTASVFGQELHAYVITDAIRDEKVLKFKVDYHDVRPRFKALESEQDAAKLSAAENRKALLHPQRIQEITASILGQYRQKTHRSLDFNAGFNAMFAVSSVDAAKLYYEAFKKQQARLERPLKVATIFSFAANEEQGAIGEILDESLETAAMDQSAKTFLTGAIRDYNALFKTNYSVSGDSFENYYKDLARRVKGYESDGAPLKPSEKVDLLIVVGMFLTGFDAPHLNTLFVDKNLRYHGLIQAFSRTNRILNKTKSFGNIVTFRNIEQATIDAITLFGDKNTRNVVLERSYTEYMEGSEEASTEEGRRGFIAISQDLERIFPDPTRIESDAQKKAFATLFGQYLRLENILQNYDEFTALKAVKGANLEDPEQVERLKALHHLDEGAIEILQTIPMPTERQVQDYRSVYNDIREGLRREQAHTEEEEGTVVWDDVVFEVELLKSQEINLDYILELILEKNRTSEDKDALIKDVQRTLRASIGHRAKEGLMVDFIRQTDLDALGDKTEIIETFFHYARAQRAREIAALIEEEQLKEVEARHYISASLRRELASDRGTALNDILPKMSPLNPKYLPTKQRVLERITQLVAKYKEVGGEI